VAIHNLADHDVPYVTVRELAEYWRVSQKQIRRRVAAGHLSGLRLGPRLWRITVASALAFERASELAFSDGGPANDALLPHDQNGALPQIDRSSRRRPH